MHKKNIIWHTQILPNGPQELKNVSFHIKSLFTQIPPEVVLTNIDQILELDDSWKKATALDKDDILQLSKICLSSTVFQYDNKVYQQIHRTPMGSSASGPFTEIVMQANEKTEHLSCAHQSY